MNNFLKRRYSKCLYLVAICTVFTFLSCGGGGGGGDGSSTATGTFKDSNVWGLSYESGDNSGVTDQYGTFIYESGKSVTFSIGAITLGSTTGKSVITPTDLVTNGNSSSRAVQNIARFLMMLDEDSNPNNGIKISEQVQAVASNWTQVNFYTSNLALELEDIIQDCSNADGGVHTLPDANTAKNHLEETMRCVYAGGYKGTPTGAEIKAHLVS